MSLQTRLTALAQAVGADIKLLRADVDTIGPKSAKAFTFSLSVAQTLGNGNIINWTAETTDTDNLRSGSGVQNIVLPAGIWWVEASVRPDQALSAGAYIQSFLQVNGVSQSEGIAVQVSGATSPRCHIPGIAVVSDGTTSIRVIVWSNTTGNTFQSTLSTISATLSGGPKGPKGDVGGNSTVPIEAWKTVGADGGATTFVNGWGNYGGAYPLQYRKRPDGIVEMRGLAKGASATATASAIFTLPADYVPALPNTSAHFFESTAYSGSAYVDSSKIQVAFNGTVTSTFLCPSNGFLAFDTVRFPTAQTTFPSGPQGPKGDAGGIGVVKTLNWNTATQPNLYRSTNDGLEQTINGPGDTLNPPHQAGIVSLHENGAIVQRVWDLDMKVPYTRYRASDGVTWSAWVKDLTKPPVIPEVMFGGPADAEGDERYLQSPTMKTQGVRWRQVYNASSPNAYKWEFAGGAEYRSKATAGYTCITPNTWELVSAAIFPRFTCPMSGVYRVKFGCRFQQVVNVGVEGYMGIGRTTDATPLDSIRFNAGQHVSGVEFRYSMYEMEVTLTEGQILALFHNTQTTVANVAYAGQYMLITPLRT